jgi:hypothetical protein
MGMGPSMGHWDWDAHVSLSARASACPCAMLDRPKSRIGNWRASVPSCKLPIYPLPTALVSRLPSDTATACGPPPA